MLPVRLADILLKLVIQLRKLSVRAAQAVIRVPLLTRN